MVAGLDTFIHEMLAQAGFENLIQGRRYPEISREELLDLNPDYLLLSSEPFPFKAKHFEEFGEFLPNTKIRLVDGEFFSWYGSRLLQAKRYFELI